MGSPLRTAHGRVAVGAVIGAVTAAMFVVGVLSEGSHRPSPHDRAAVEPVPPGQQPRPANEPATTEPSRPSSSRSTTTTTTTTRTTTTRSEPPADPTSTEEEPPPPPPPATTTNGGPPTTTTTRCNSLICVG